MRGKPCLIVCDRLLDLCRVDVGVLVLPLGERFLLPFNGISIPGGSEKLPHKCFAVICDHRSPIVSIDGWMQTAFANVVTLGEADRILEIHPHAPVARCRLGCSLVWPFHSHARDRRTAGG